MMDTTSIDSQSRNVNITFPTIDNRAQTINEAEMFNTINSAASSTMPRKPYVKLDNQTKEDLKKLKMETK